MREAVKVILFAAAVGLVCSGLLVGATVFTAPYRESNERAEEIRNYLSALGVDAPADASSDMLLELFEENVIVEESGSIQTYRYVPSGSNEARAVAIGFSGMGLHYQNGGLPRDRR